MDHSIFYFAISKLLCCGDQCYSYIQCPPWHKLPLCNYYICGIIYVFNLPVSLRSEPKCIYRTNISVSICPTCKFEVSSLLTVNHKGFLKLGMCTIQLCCILSKVSTVTLLRFVIFSYNFK